LSRGTNWTQNNEVNKPKGEGVLND
jgi:hypothetical protein